MLAYPSDHQIKITVEPINGIHLSECEFDCYLFTYPSKKIVINKSDCIKVNADSYIVQFNTREIGRGNVKMSLNIQIPDSSYDDGLREVNTAPLCTGINDV